MAALVKQQNRFVRLQTCHLLFHVARPVEYLFTDSGQGCKDHTVVYMQHTQASNGREIV